MDDKIFKEAGEQNSRNSYYQFWQQDNQSKIFYTPEFAAQKLEYIHNNPVEAGMQKNIFIAAQEIIIMVRIAD